MNTFRLAGYLVVGVVCFVSLLGLADGLNAQAQKGGQKAGGVAGGIQMAGSGVKDGMGKTISALAKQGLKGKDLADAVHQMKGKGGMGKGKGKGGGGAGKGGPANNTGQQGNVMPANNIQAAVVGAQGGLNQKKGGGGAAGGKSKGKGK